MAVNLDLDEPVGVIVAICDNLSEDPVEVVPGSNVFRGGYATPHPVYIIPVEGTAGKPRKGQTNLKGIPGKAEIVVYAITEDEDDLTKNEDYADVEVDLTIDIYHGENKTRANSLRNEIKRLLMFSAKSPGGGYHILRRGQTRFLSNRKAGFWRYSLDVTLVAVSQYNGYVAP